VTNVLGIFNLNEKYKIFMKPGSEGRPFSNLISLSSSSFNSFCSCLSNNRRL